jgi:acetyl-CoA C-acetyltransferase
MSNVPYYLDKGRSGYRYGHGSITDGVLKDGLWDAFNNIHMGGCAEDCAVRYNITRKDQDAYAIESYRR